MLGEMLGEELAKALVFLMAKVLVVVLDPELALAWGQELAWGLVHA